MINVLLLEDEYRSALELKSLLESISPDVQICGMLQSVEEAVDWFRENPMPHLIFSDIELGDGICFDLFSVVDVTAPVVFCTAYDRYALSAFEHNGIDYLLKPIKREDLERTFNKLEYFSKVWQNPEHTARFNRMLQSFRPTYKSVLPAFMGSRIVPIPVHEISFIYTNNRVFVFSGEERFEIKTTLDRLTEQLDPDLFYRANRQFIISKNDIAEVRFLEARKLQVIMKTLTPEKVIISKSKSAHFSRWLKGM